MAMSRLCAFAAAAALAVNAGNNPDCKTVDLVSAIESNHHQRIKNAMTNDPNINIVCDKKSDDGKSEEPVTPLYLSIAKQRNLLVFRLLLGVDIQAVGTSPAEFTEVAKNAVKLTETKLKTSLLEKEIATQGSLTHVKELIKAGAELFPVSENNGEESKEPTTTNLLLLAMRKEKPMLLAELAKKGLQLSHHELAAWMCGSDRASMAKSILEKLFDNDAVAEQEKFWFEKYQCGNQMMSPLKMAAGKSSVPLAKVVMDEMIKALSQDNSAEHRRFINEEVEAIKQMEGIEQIENIKKELVKKMNEKKNIFQPQVAQVPAPEEQKDEVMGEQDEVMGEQKYKVMEELNENLLEEEESKENIERDSLDELITNAPEEDPEVHQIDTSTKQ